jgi:plastocyanin
MRFLPPLCAIVLLAAIAWTASLVGRDPDAVKESQASAQRAGFEDPRPQIPWPIRRTDNQPTIAVVKIDNFAFEPASITVAKGTTVEWTNGDDVPHTVVEKKVRFKSKALDTDDRYRHTFNEPGSFSYFCSLHPHMVGEIRVITP